MLKAGATHDAWVPAMVAAVLAALGAVSLQVAAALNVLPEAPVELAWLLGWVLLSWSIFAISAALLLAWRSPRTTNPPLAPSLLVIGAAVVALAIAVALHPPFGAGAGVG
ncbi:hypothetical protein L332_08900 [Agrococcus pavilionensis RW1]|uniref:Uncharacterized protein n=1 Tax=Agrococcus pavilionensis RW1 TaxID=1330458 RepID=U1LBQ4_9MICO|nr:hypothetical protein [Agrococcus pavilionensis]ERG64563.1 hypothetical protein L332_08900 [Agrococcus pavilionensis RW1]